MTIGHQMCFSTAAWVRRAILSAALAMVGLAGPLSRPATADVLVIATGRRIECVIERETDDTYYFQTKEGKGSVSKLVVLEVQRVTAAENAALRAQWEPAEAPAPAATPEGPRKQASGKVERVRDRTFSRTVLKSSQPVLVDFYATWCGPCKTQSPILVELAREYRGKVRFAKLDVDKDEATAAKYQVRLLPTLILFHKGKPVQRLHGLHTTQQLRAILDKAGT